VNKSEMLKGLEGLEDLIYEQQRLGKDGLIFIFEKGLWSEFMQYHCQKYLDRKEK